MVGIYFLVPYFREKEALAPFWKFLTFTANFGLESSHFGTFSHVWSLCVEEHFYLLLPLILTCLVFKNLLSKSLWILITLFILGIFLRMYLWQHIYPSNTMVDASLANWLQHFYYPTYNRLDGLLVGVGIAFIQVFKPNFWLSISKFGNYFTLLGLILMVIIFGYFSDLASYITSVLGFPLIAVAYGFLVMGAICPSSFLYQWQSKLTTLIATLSYAVYLFHKGIFHIVQQVFSEYVHIDSKGNLMLVLCLVICFTGAWILHIGVEKPFLNIRNKIIKKPVSKS